MRMVRREPRLSFLFLAIFCCCACDGVLVLEAQLEGREGNDPSDCVLSLNHPANDNLFFAKRSKDVVLQTRPVEPEIREDFVVPVGLWPGNDEYVVAIDCPGYERYRSPAFVLPVELGETVDLGTIEPHKE